MKIHIMGASCAGSTTLGNTLAKRLGYTYLDTDAYYFVPSEIPFSVKREPTERIAMMKTDFEGNENVIVGGSLVSWGDDWFSKFDLVVFLYLPHDIRMARLHAREVERYGDKIFNDPYRAMQYQQFTAWAKGYDDNTTNGRNLGVHLDWLSKVTCPVLKIEGDTTVEERIERVMSLLKVS
ncbi:AAA family ATPase [Mucilaginibacter auburnensis]|uniref:Adenylate kinase family enzyme n=1 Tax=Mucilaginibacter auburnensis TaxID=1457233 RepID=A0A2H9VMT3_9SPHI|nr:AAA family ATPase [Mucilaginibacter auburnensis]PJJ79623.1 adenylate kinase family enzyme [Mucilaginibacter auburnensis]